MKIDGTSNNSFQNKVLIDTFIEQISALQTDVGNLQIADDNLSQALATKANAADINTAVNTGTLGAQTGNIKTLKVQGTGSSATIENATIGTASIGTETVTQSNITNLEVMDVDAGTVRTGTLTVENDATISGNIAVQDVSAKDISSASVDTRNITATEVDINKLEARNAEITGKLEVNDLEVSGNFTGVSNIASESVNTENITADAAEIETLDVENIRSWVTQVMNQDQILNPPTPALGNIDTYTIELPRFDGVFLLSWEDADVVWSATVIGNGKSYGISWGSRTDQNYITDLFQYNGKLYIRITSNGKLKYAYATTKELDQIVIYRNMVGWVPSKSLEELCDELSHIQNVYPSGTAWLGPVYIPRLLESNKGAFNFKGSCTFASIPALEDAFPGDVWNITDEAYTDNRFIEGAGKPINAGDDIIAVTIEINNEPILKWDKFNAGVNYENFVAEDITATESLKSNGTFEVDGVSTFNDNITQTGNYTATGNLNRTGNEIVSGTETVGNLDATSIISVWIYPARYGDYYFDENLNQISLPSTEELSRTELTTTCKYVGGRLLISNSRDGHYATSIERVLKLAPTLNEMVKRPTEYSSDYDAYYDGVLYYATFKSSGAGYNNQEERLKVRGSAQVTRDLKVERDLFVGGLLTVDSNAVLTTVDTTNDVIQNSTDVLTSGGAYTALATKINNSEKGVSNGVATLDANGRIPYSQLPESAMEYKGTWDASTNTPTLVDGTGTNGDFYIVSADGTVTFSAGRTFTFYVNDRVIYDGSLNEWVRLPASVDYENFIAESITATESLKSEGTFEVDGNSTFNNSITQTGNYTATGNLNRTGNETISGLVVIGDLN